MSTREPLRTAAQAAVLSKQRKAARADDKRNPPQTNPPQLGATVQAKVSGSTQLLVCGAGGGRKRADAAAAGVDTKGEGEFWGWLDGLLAAREVGGRSGPGRGVGREETDRGS